MSDVILFDLDGTLTNSRPGIVNSLKYMFDDFGIEHPDDDTIRTFLGPPLAVTLRDHYGMDNADILRGVAKYREHYHEVGLFENEVYDGIPQLLAELSALDFTLATATSKPTEPATRILEHYDLAQYFDFIGGASLDGTRDAKADVIAHSLDAVGIPTDDIRQRLATGTRIVMVGDREHDVNGAKAHGIPTVGVLWGYGSEYELAHAGAIMTVPTPAMLSRVLRTP